MSNNTIDDLVQAVSIGIDAENDERRRARNKRKAERRKADSKADSKADRRSQRRKQAKQKARRKKRRDATLTQPDESLGASASGSERSVSTTATQQEKSVPDQE